MKQPILLVSALITAACGLALHPASGLAQSKSAVKPKAGQTARHASASKHSTSHKSTRHYSQTAKETPAHHNTHARYASSRSGRGKRHSTRLKRTGSKYRLARLHLAPERAEEIQTALVKAGYLNEVPNGVWDDATEKAMKRYQADHHFPTTGLPESKTLMSLGLGPHPLPEDIVRSAPGSAVPPPPAAGDPAPTSEGGSQTGDAADSGVGRSTPP